MSNIVQRAPCGYCEGPVVGRKDKKWCSGSCRARQARGVPKEKKFKEQPTLLEMEVREWRSLAIVPSYEISNDGRVRRKTAGSNRKAGVLLRCNIGSEGYPEYRLYDESGKHRAWLAHRLVALAFLPPPLPGQTFVLHGDDNRLNPRVDNLRWGTPQDNSDDAARNGRIPRGEAHYWARRRVA